jgi:cyclic pyranopterin phosphate synthase
VRPGSPDRRRAGPKLPVRTTETHLRTLLRAGADDGQLAAAWRGAVAAKLPHHGINDPGFLQPARPMSAIGG